MVVQTRNTLLRAQLSFWALTGRQWGVVSRLVTWHKNAPLHDCHITDTFPLHKAVTQRYSPGMTTYGYIRTSRIFSKSAALPKGRNGDTSYTLTPMPLLRHRQSNSEVSP